MNSSYFSGRRPRGHQQKFRKTPRPTEMTMPDVPDEYFYKELMFTKHEQEIKGSG